MDFVLIIAFVGCLFLGIVSMTRVEKIIKRPDIFPFVKRQALCTQKERKFLGCLVMAVGSDYLIFSKVRLADLVKINKGLKEKDKVRVYEKVSKDHVDFVLCHKHNTEIVCVIDLYDLAGETKVMKKRALYLDKLFKTIDVPFVRFPIMEKYPIRVVKESINRVIQRSSTKAAEEQSWEYMDRAG